MSYFYSWEDDWYQNCKVIMMKNDLTTGAWQHNIGCPIRITLLSTSDGPVLL